MTRRFFFYGTLMAGSANPLAQELHGRLRPLGVARARGRLFAVPDEGGWYPALIAGDDAVRGIVYEALPMFGPDDLARLDHYEGAEYERRRIATDRFGEAEVYWWTDRVPADAEPIAGGDFAGWLAATGRRAFGG